MSQPLRWRSKEDLEWVKKLLDEKGLYLDTTFNIVRCKTCGCPAQICTCPKTKGENRL